MPYIGRDTDKISNVEVLDNITFDGSSSYTLQKGGSNFTPSSANTLLLSIDGVVQAGNFTVSGSTIDFGTAVAGTSTCDFVLHYGVGLITSPSDGTVTTAKLADSSVSLAKLTATGTKDATTFLRGDNSFASPQGVYESQLLHIKDEKSNNTYGGTFTSGAWQKRDLNTVKTNEITGASLSSSVITLPSGTYYIEASAPAIEVGAHKAKLYNTSDSSDVIIGTSQHNRSDNNYASSRSIVSGRFTISAQKNFELQHRCITTRGADGLGFASNFSVVEVYSDVKIWKVA